MIGKSVSIFAAVYFCFAATFCYSDDLSAESCQSTVDAFSSLTEDLQTPWYFYRKNAVRIGLEFNAGSYFSALTHLSMSDGYVLDYVYKYDFMGGYPILYPRKVWQLPFFTYSRYLRRNVGKEPEYEYLNYVQVDDTEYGFFEFVVFRIMGGQFYLHWHAGYNDDTVVCDSSGLEMILSEIDYMYASEYSSVPDEARSLDIEPVVALEDRTVLVEVIYFTKWGGFKQASYIISRDFPHTVLNEEHETLVPYDCGWVY